MTDNPRSRPELTATAARAGRIVKGGAVLRILLVSIVLAVVGMAIAYFAFS
jgi:hypothetical protein